MVGDSGVYSARGDSKFEIGADGVPSMRSSSKPPLISCGKESGSVLPAAGLVAFGVGTRPGVRVGVGSGPGVVPGGSGVGIGVICGGVVGAGGGVSGGGTKVAPEDAKWSRCTVNAES